MVFVIAIFVGYYVVWGVTPALHTPLMALTNAISSVIVVGALLAVGVSLMGYGTWIAKLFGFLALVMASINIFGGFLVTQRMLAMYKKKDPEEVTFGNTQKARPMIPRNPLSLTLACVLALSSLLAGCASPERRRELMIENQKAVDRAKAKYTTEVTAVMRQVQPHVTSRHLEECRRALEKGGMLAAEYKLVNPPVPHIGYSCYVQGRDKSSMFAVERPGIGYLASFTKVGSGVGPDRAPGYCGFVLEGNRLTLHSYQRSATTHGQNTCARL